ncbi:MAG: Exodeoxyribonuclease [Ignavibacteria bacterium]|nr:Exodeoxyribonuclease [Ignavibacteria bacterium]
MKLISWNINGYRAVTGQNASRRYDVVEKKNKLFAYLEAEKPDLICLQEIKGELDKINPELQTPPGYESHYHICRSKKGYSGVAVFTKLKPKRVITEFGIERFDIEGRFIRLDFDDFTLLNIYFPKGYTDNERLDYKLEFYDAIYDYLKTLKKKTKNIIISGDYNTAHKEIDLARPKDNVNISGFLEVERIKMDWLPENGFVDAFRLFNSEGGHYSWWSQRGQARANNVGWRIDYHFISGGLKKSAKNCYMQPDVLGSDHCPVVLELK